MTRLTAEQIKLINSELMAETGGLDGVRDKALAYTHVIHTKSVPLEFVLPF